MFPENFHNEVQEVIDFAIQCHFLFGNAPPEGLNVKVVPKIPKDSLDAGPDGKDYKDLKDGEIEFRGIREVEISSAFGLFSRDKEKNSEGHQVEHILLRRDFYKKIEQKIAHELKKMVLIDIDSELVDQKSLIADLIRGDMIDCALSRIAFGKCGNFWDTVFEIYKSGGMPVGWSGKYPEGKLMAIYPGIK